MPSETEWIRHLLSDLPFSESIDPTLSLTQPRTVVVFADHGMDPARSEPLISSLVNARTKGAAAGLIHVGDRFYRARSALYDAASFVLRVGHWYPDGTSKVLPVALGPAATFLRAMKRRPEQAMTPAPQRRYLWSFAGQIHSKPTRVAMAKAFRPVRDGYLYETQQFKDPNALCGDDYQAILSQTIFALCPRAASVQEHLTADTFRAWEAAAAGAIPLVDNSYYAEAFGAPFPRIQDDWSDGPLYVENACLDRDRLLALQRQCHDWWAEYWRDVPRLVRRHVDAHDAGS